MFSVVEQGGFQYKVKEGDVIAVPLMDAAAGSEVTLEKVLMVGSGADVKIGKPVVPGVTVKATVLRHFKGRKVLIFKRRRREDYRRKIGHRQHYTELKVTAISAETAPSS